METGIPQAAIVEQSGGWLADYQRAKHAGGSAMNTFQGVLVDEIVLPQSAVEAPDPAAMVRAAIAFADAMQTHAFYLPGEFAQEAAWIFYVNDYLDQVKDGGHVQYFANRGGDELALRCTAFGLKSMLADPHLALFNLSVQLRTGEPKAARNAALKAGFRNTSDASRDLDRKFAVIEQEEPLVPRQKTWLQSLRKVRVTPDEEVRQRIAQLIASNPLRDGRIREAARLQAERENSDPIFLSVRALCEQAGLRFGGLRGLGLTQVRTVWPEGPNKRAFAWRVETDRGQRTAVFYADGGLFKRHLGVLVGPGEPLPLGSLSMTPAEFGAVVPSQRA
jgi:hypothetical protein